MSRLSYTFSRLFGRVQVVGQCKPVLLTLAVCALAVGALAPQYAAGDATPGPEPTPGLSGLPDGRVYEEVSPPNKNGNETLPERPSFVAPNGDGVMYGGSGGFGEASNATRQPTFVSERTSHGWVTRSAHGLPAPGAAGEEQNVSAGTTDTLMVPSSDLSHLLFGTIASVPYVGAPDGSNLKNNIFLAGPDASTQPQWVGRSMIEGAPGGAEIESPQFAEIDVAGVTPDLKTIYFYYEGTLLPGASHLYEYREGVLSDAGVLPAGEASGGEATAAAQPVRPHLEHSGVTAADAYDNQVSADGSRIFFTRTDKGGTLELWVRVTAPDGSQSTELVSQSQMPGHAGEPASHGPVAVPSTMWSPTDPFIQEMVAVASPPSYVYASPDGVHAFFQSVDRLTSAAPENGAAKTYDFNVDTGTLTYLPGILGSIVTASNDGSSLIFENTSKAPSFELERWTAGPEGGTVTPIVALPSASYNSCGSSVLCVGPAYLSNNSKTVVFSTESPIAGFNDGGEHYERGERQIGELPLTEDGLWPNTEVFRYEVESNELDCLSCPPLGTTPSSEAIISRNSFLGNSASAPDDPVVIGPGRSVSPDGRQVFFESREALVPQDTNGKADVYEWEEGKLYLLSSGHSSESSYFSGLSESGNDAFFMASEGIAPGDKDGGYDVYDARVPRPGDSPPQALPCTGSVCQGPPSVPQLLGLPASAQFSGVGNLTPPAPARVQSKSLTRTQKLARALKQCRHHTKARVRKRCEKQALRKYAAKASRAHNRDRNGRGN